ncbi:hypothetical protein OBBRIDRAFT_133449 [Obba rivulosa]|uniref:Uncharacterized protein n=1 Tax=Obba rivulosa TaxID=1052685 RepID=A0A8E2DJE9_9APHY|nr:hypothetical protein OBBRIDRAFT_133449 [Obba rivulosa]
MRLIYRNLGDCPPRATTEPERCVPGIYGGQYLSRHEGLVRVSVGLEEREELLKIFEVSQSGLHVRAPKPNFADPPTPSQPSYTIVMSRSWS